ncbi:MAG: acetate--CoA ligase [Crocinitomicaceae bacterium]|nr:acetate--CoA ligase [Crocinitomicaceae bacterium]
MEKPFFQITTEGQFQDATERAIFNPELYWEDIAKTFRWRKRWTDIQSGNLTDVNVKWFEDATLNITENCIDRHAETHPDKTAIVWEPNNPDDTVKKFSYAELRSEVNKMSNVLKACGVEKGDRVCLYLPMIPEACFAMLACARIGAVHSVVFAGFSANALRDRIKDAKAKMVITSDGLIRGGKKLLLRNIVSDALEGCDSVETVLTIKHTGDNVQTNHLDKWYHELKENASAQFEAVEMSAEDPLFILYTSGSTGAPKGVVHTCGGYMVYAEYSFRNVFQPENDDVFWCTADVGWITGHTYITYGPLLAGVTNVMFEGVPTYPDCGRFWAVCEKHKVNQFYTAPTAIRALMAAGDDYPKNYKLDSLKVIGSVGEPINEEAWKWYWKYVGKERCPIVDTWWQTETGGIMISNLGILGEQRPTFAGRPLPGIHPVLLDPEGNEKEQTEDTIEGLLAIKQPWPSMIRTTWGNHGRCRAVYFTPFLGYYFTGDGAKRTKEGMFRIIGRVDDVINVSGHRLGTAEIENAINEHDKVIESAVVGYSHDIKGQGVFAFAICEPGTNSEGLSEEISEKVIDMIGKIAKPDHVLIVEALPKTRSGKIMRRILRKIANGEHDNLGDTSTLLDPNAVEAILAAIKD